MYPALMDLLVTLRYIHIKIEELYNNSQNSNAIYIYTYSNDFLFIWDSQDCLRDLKQTNGLNVHILACIFDNCLVYLFSMDF